MHLSLSGFIVDKKNSLIETYITTPKCINRKQVSRAGIYKLLKGQVVNLFDFLGHVTSVSAIQICGFSMKAFIGNMKKNASDCIPI